MPVASTGFALFLYVRDFTAGSHFAVTANHAATGESSEAEKPNETHDVLPLEALNTTAICMPDGHKSSMTRVCMKRRSGDEHLYGTLEVKTLSWI